MIIGNRKTKKVRLIIRAKARCVNHPGDESRNAAWARGLCKRCYDKALKKENPEYVERQRANAAAWVATHRERNRATNKKWRAKLDPAYNRARGLKKFGLTIDDYEGMLSAQNGVCTICRKPPKPGKRLNVDHCHQTGSIRGLLCFRCNFGLSFFYDDAIVLERALNHVKINDESKKV